MASVGSRGPGSEIVVTDGMHRPEEDEQTSFAGIQSIETGLRLLVALARPGAPHMLKTIAAGAGMPASKAHRYIVSFGRMGFVEQDPSSGRYRLGPAALHIGLAALSGLDVVRLGSAAVTSLREEIDETVALAIWTTNGPTFVRLEEASRPITVNVKARFDYAASSIGDRPCFRGPPSARRCHTDDRTRNAGRKARVTPRQGPIKSGCRRNPKSDPVLWIGSRNGRDAPRRTCLERPRVRPSGSRSRVPYVARFGRRIRFESRRASGACAESLSTDHVHSVGAWRIRRSQTGDVGSADRFETEAELSRCGAGRRCVARFAD